MKPQPTAALQIQHQTITIKLRLKDKHASELNRMARAVNFVWNYCNDIQKRTVQNRRKWLEYIDLAALTAGSSKELNILSSTIQRICKSYDVSRKTNKKPWLKFRSKKSLGWIPFNTEDLSFDGLNFRFRKNTYYTMHLHPLLTPGIKIGAGSFNQDSKGNWYLNATIKSDCLKSHSDKFIGIDLGLHDFATLSNGEKIQTPKFYRKSENSLANNQRAKKKKSVRNIHAKIRNRRKDFLHKLSLSIVKQFGLIIVGDVSSSKLAKTNMAKSVFDAGWSGFKKMLSYKAIRHGGRMIEADERCTTQSCSCCGALPEGRPKGIAGLRIREWICDECGTVHDRDINAAKNILRVGLDTLAEGAKK
jgi:IS605 OrfB family transposase